MAKLSEEEKKNIYDTYRKKAPSDNLKYILVLVFLCIALAAYLELLPKSALFVAEKGWAKSVNGIIFLSYVIFFAVLAPIAALELYLNKKLADRYNERKKFVHRANSEFWNELFNKEGYSDWRSVVEKYKDL